MRKPRALFGNAAFDLVAGSELVILEAVEALIARGWDCDICAWYHNHPMTALAREAGATIIETPIDIPVFAYDLVWMQNRIEPVLNYAELPDEAARTLFVFAHLDPNWSFAQPGILHEPLLGGCFLGTSPHSEERLVSRGLARERIMLFRNPAPERFVGPPKNEGLRSILIVSNHIPDELRDAAALLRDKGIAVSIWGANGDTIGKRITPQALIDADAVVTIGKTVPYALRARRPVYVYDHFGGPGWLMPQNFATTRARNFSGLCCERKIDGAQIADEIRSGFAQANHHCAVSLPFEPEDYSLDLFFDRLLALQEAAPSPAEHRRRLVPQAVGLLAERELALCAGRYFGSVTATHRKAAAAA